MAGKNKKTDTKTENKAPILPLTVKAQFTKDMSFESQGPIDNPVDDINLNVEVRTNPLNEKNKEYEVELLINAEGKSKKKTIFNCELNYAGVFIIGDIEDSAVVPVLLIECPRILFPFARNIIADATSNGGFPPLALAPIDFAELFRQKVSQMQSDQDGKKKA